MDSKLKALVDGASDEKLRELAAADAVRPKIAVEIGPLDLMRTPLLPAELAKRQAAPKRRRR